jgi:hypothetical protein
MGSEGEGGGGCNPTPKNMEPELELIRTQMAQKPILRAEVYARALRASQDVKRAEVWMGARFTLCVGGAWASAGLEGTRLGCRDL